MATGLLAATPIIKGSWNDGGSSTHWCIARVAGSIFSEPQPRNSKVRCSRDTVPVDKGRPFGDGRRRRYMIPTATIYYYYYYYY